MLLAESFIANHEELNLEEIVREEIEQETNRLAEGKCKCSNQTNEHLAEYHTIIEDLSAKLKQHFHH